MSLSILITYLQDFVLKSRGKLTHQTWELIGYNKSMSLCKGSKNLHWFKTYKLST